MADEPFIVSGVQAANGAARVASVKLKVAVSRGLAPSVRLDRCTTRTWSTLSSTSTTNAFFGLLSPLDSRGSLDYLSTTPVAQAWPKPRLGPGRTPFISSYNKKEMGMEVGKGREKDRR
ncbi:hypothetical protein Ancab_031492 [Ancistrocladus abbreviatus]